MRIARCSGNGDVPRAGIFLGVMLAGLLVLASVIPVAAAPTGQPIRIGSTLALTGSPRPHRAAPQDRRARCTSRS